MVLTLLVKSSTLSVEKIMMCIAKAEQNALLNDLLA